MSLCSLDNSVTPCWLLLKLELSSIINSIQILNEFLQPLLNFHLRSLRYPLLLLNPLFQDVPVMHALFAL
jgi:hypothetical protein